MQNIEETKSALQQAILDLQSSTSIIQNTLQFLNNTTNNNTMGYTEQEIISIVQNGQDSTHRFVTDTEKATWNSGGSGTNYGWYHPEDYGAVGDGIINDAAAFQAMNDAAARGGKVVVGHKTYLINTQVNITKNFAFIGEGADDIYATGGASVFKTTSPTLKMFKVTAPAVTFEKISFLNTATTPTAGTAISFDNNGTDYSLNPNSFKLIDISVDGFYDNLSIINSSNWEMRGIIIKNPARYGIDINNVLLPDGGDAVISGGNIFPGTKHGIVGIHHTAGGGLKMSDVKFNGGETTGTRFDYAYFADGINGTSDLNISNCGFENFNTNGIRLVGGNFVKISITGNHFASYSQATADIYMDGMSGIAVFGNAFQQGSVYAIYLANCSHARLGNAYLGYTTPEKAVSCTDVKTTQFTDIIDITTLSTPGSFVATPSGTNAILTWADVANESSYKVEYSLDGSTGWTQVGGTLAANTTTYTHTGLSAGSVFYRLTAVGDGTTYANSAYATANTTISGSVVVQDNFTDADGTLLSAHTVAPTNTPGTGWTATSDFSISGNKLSIVGTGAVLIATKDAGISNGTASIDVNRGASSAVDMGFLFRYVDDNNYWLVDFNSTGNLYLYEKTAGTIVGRGTIARPFTNSTNYTLKVVLAGSSITVSVDDTNAPGSPSTLSYTSTAKQTATRFGIWTAGGGTVTYDNLIITS